LFSNLLSEGVRMGSYGPFFVGGAMLGVLLMEKEQANAPKGAKLVSGRTRLVNVHPQLQQLISMWEYDGSHDIFIPADGAMREGIEASSHQLQLYLSGRSGARTLAETPHGRGAALDVWPVGYDFAKDVSLQPLMKTRLEKFGAFAKTYGFTWGGDWSSIKDYPHVEITNWRNLPYVVKSNA
jgi:hypothetical protein